MCLSSQFGKEAINSASDLLLSPSPCVPLFSFRHLQSHLLGLLEKALRVKVWRSHSWGEGPPGYEILTDSFYPFAPMMHLGKYRSEKTSLGTFPTKPWSDHLSTSPLLKLPPRHFFTLCHAHSAVLPAFAPPLLQARAGEGDRELEHSSHGSAGHTS